MFGNLSKYIAVFLVGFVVTYLLTPVVRSLAVRFGIVDLPDERRPHKLPTARGGGLAVFLGFHAACLVAVAFPWPKFAGELDFAWWQRLVLPSLVLLVVGLIDDIRGLRPLLKLGGQAVAAALIFLGGARFGSLFGHPLPMFLDFVMVEVWLLAVINAFNLIDGLDGLASGLAIISALGLCGIIALEHLPADVLVLLGLIGACLAFLRYNLHPASIFLGDTGSMFIGFTLGAVSLQTFTKSTFILSLTIPMLVLGVPIYDTLLAVWRRSARMYLIGDKAGSGLNRIGIMHADVEHLHHRLLKAGLSTRRVATLLCLGNALLVAFGLLMTSFQSHASGILLMVLLAGTYILLRHLALIELRDTGAALLAGLRRPTHSTLKALAYPVWDMACFAGAVAVSMWFFEGTRVMFWRAWFLDLPVWVTPTFILLAVSETYVTVWSRVRLRDILKLTLTLQLGLLASLGIALLIDPYNNVQQCFIRALVIGSLCHPAILCSRMIYRFVEELVNWSRAKSDMAGEGKRVVLYGTGGRCWLFLSLRALDQPGRSDSRSIIGMIDDDPSLNSRWIYGYKVLGAGEDLPKLIAPNRISGVIIVEELNAKARKTLEEMAAKHGFQLSEWCFGERVIEPCTKPLPAFDTTQS
jgi:UDP-N-acetylmuramyl pentapeptide phosphotransferase/UDP-N-acetylglucosamine-1-phosphate transferase